MSERDPIAYFNALGCMYYHEYDRAYGLLDVAGKTVVVVGADCGSTAVYLLKRGARYIIQYEREEKLRRLWEDKVCKDWDICDRAVMLGEWTGVEYPPADVFIIDCEGCEAKMNLDALTKYEQWCIAVHDWIEGPWTYIERIVTRLGPHVITYVTPDSREIVLCHKRAVKKA